MNNSLTVETAINIVSRLHSLYSDFPYNIEKTKLDYIAKAVRNSLWEDNSDGFYIVEPFMLAMFITGIHQILGGKERTIDIDEVKRITKKVLRQLSDDGKAQQISKDEWEKFELLDFIGDKQRKRISEEKWRIPPVCQQIFGKGEGWVYLYYFDKEKAEAQDQGNEVWPCKIGRTERDPERRI